MAADSISKGLLVQYDRHQVCKANANIYWLTIKSLDSSCLWEQILMMSHYLHMQYRNKHRNINILNPSNLTTSVIQYL